MNSKIIFFDIDGTILSHRTFQISDSTRSAIRNAKDNGHLVFANTGRTYAEIDDTITGIGFNGFVCGCGTYITYQGDTLLHAPISELTCKKIVEDLRKYRIEAVLEGTDTIYFDSASTMPDVVKLRDFFQNRYRFNIQDWDHKNLSYDKFCIHYDNLDHCHEFLDTYQNQFDYIPHDRMLEIIPKGYSKASGIEFLINHLNIPHENTFAIGDSANDLPMLEYAKYSIGMGNCSDCVSEIVSFRTKDVDDDGIEHALRYYQII